MQRPKNLDSFIKESLRPHPLIFATFERRAMQPFTLSHGYHIPKGTILEIENQATSRI
ncbi:hypothetical protein F4779DRAFT_569011 [Xylariaceae sp. FL0662B]|nr:hypothetical protein F4779DRAFT_569011 [Xylariaceae sp. FL0662B]